MAKYRLMNRFSRYAQRQHIHFFAFIFLLTTTLLWGRGDAQAQTENDDAVPVRFRHYTTADGLPDNTINKIHQDQHGFMWLGTIEGLIRFDGYHFNVYTAVNDSEQEGLLNSNIRDIYEDEEGVLWLATLRGVYRYDRLGETTQPSPILQVTGRSHHIIQDDSGQFYFGGAPNVGLLRYDADTAAIEPYPIGNAQGVRGLAFDRAGALWTLRTEGFGRWVDGELVLYGEQFI